MSRPLRFTFILFLAALGTDLAAVGGWRYARASAPVSGPIIVISIDTLRADHLPAYGYTQGQDAGDRRARRRRRRLRAGVLARAADAAGARVAAVGTAAVRDRRARQRRLRRQARRAAAAADAARSRLHHRRRRLGVRAAQGNRHRPGLRLLRRRDAAQLAGAVDRPGAARRRRVGGDRRALARLDRHLARVPLPASLRAAQAVRAAGALRRVRALRRRDRLHRRNRRPAGALPEVASALRPLDDRAAVGSRRGARRSRRAGARPVRLRRGDPRAADHQAGEQRRRRPSRRATWCSTSIWCRRFSIW